MLALNEVVKEDFEAVNTLIIKQLYSDVSLVEDIGAYLVESGGKRLRPLLVLLMAKCLGYKQQQHVDLAVIIEFIHTATLLHDDVVDVSAMRRGRETANEKWGNAPSVLVGDFLYSRAFQMMVSMQSMTIMSILSDTTNTISEGEVQQLINVKNPDISEADYMTVIHKKTAALFEAACETAAVLSDADEQTCIQAKLYGYHLGLAFQLIDDALDYSGDSEKLGKNVGDDLAEGKPTLPLIYAMKQGNPEQVALIRDAIEQGNTDKAAEIIAMTQSLGGLQYTQECAQQHAQEAIKILHALPKNSFKSALLDLANFSVERSF
ncbi:MAG: octaprenyl diphosphate synthase [Alteromonadaceae bacterium]|nr:MAG: octaprenyl diphosphate synthase [Alteromonadaceae bacterium]